MIAANDIEGAIQALGGKKTNNIIDLVIIHSNIPENVNFEELGHLIRNQVRSNTDFDNEMMKKR